MIVQYENQIIKIKKPAQGRLQLLIVKFAMKVEIPSKAGKICYK